MVSVRPCLTTLKSTLARVAPQGHAHSDLGSALVHGIREEAIQADQRKRYCRHCDGGEQHCLETATATSHPELMASQSVKFVRCGWPDPGHYWRH